jgi:regulatory protein
VLETDDRVQTALGLAYAYLNRRERTVAEVDRHLQQHRCEPEAIAITLKTLQGEGYLDDARYARLFTEDRRTLDQWGSDRIERTLRDRGIDRELIAEAISTVSAEGELERAIALLRRRFPEPPRDRRDRDRALGVLVRKGYDSELAVDALSAYARETGEHGLV